MTQDETAPKCCCKGETPAAESCCGPRPGNLQEPLRLTAAPWIVGSVRLAGAEVPTIRTRLDWADYRGAWKARWAINRMAYRVPPGLYAVGNPTPDCPVLVAANYKMSFDRLRSQLSGLDAWILVLDTQGVNVWCAAGKGTFGTDELVRKIEQFNLLEATSHRTVIVPQLGAPGVAAHEVEKRTGVRVVYGPVRAEDIPGFLAAGMKATRAMRRVGFSFRDRVAVIPVEWMTMAKWPLLAAVVLFLLAGLGRDGYSGSRAIGIGIPTAVMILATSFGSITLGPALLPWLPGRAFSVKGLWIGLVMLGAFLRIDWFAAAVYQNWASTWAWCLLVPAIASVLVMGFTGASTYTSLSGVRREAKFALPIDLFAVVTGLALWLVGRFL